MNLAPRHSPVTGRRVSSVGPILNYFNQAQSMCLRGESLYPSSL